MDNNRKTRSARQSRNRPRKTGDADSRRHVHTESDAFLQKAQSLSELEFTFRIVIPLFTKLGYTKVEYNGGPTEEGKDVICWGTDRLGDQVIDAIQVKKTKLTGRAADTNSLSEIITQLSQAAEKAIPTIGGLEVRPRDLYFVTPFPLASATLRSRFEAVPVLRDRHISLIDGPKLAGLVMQHIPDVARELIGSAFAFDVKLEHTLTNTTLLKALSSATTTALHDIYTDIDFSLGTPSASYLFASSFTPQTVSARIVHSRWPRVRQAAECAFRELGIALFTEDIATIESRADSALTAYTSWKECRQELERSRIHALQGLALRDRRLNDLLNELRSKQPGVSERIHNLKLRIESLDIQLRDVQDSINDPLIKQADLPYLLALRENITTDIRASTRSVTTLSRDYVADIIDIMDCMSRLRNAIQLARGEDQASAELTHLLETIPFGEIERTVDQLSLGEGTIPSFIAAYKSTLDSLQDITRQLAKLPSNMEEPDFSVTIEGPGLAAELTRRREEISEDVAVFNKATPTLPRLRSFLQSCNATITAMTALLQVNEVRDALRAVPLVDGAQAQSCRLAIPIHRLFETGMNLAVLGEAGAGKTTSLQIYARRNLENGDRDTLFLYIPLAQVLSPRTRRDTAMPPESRLLEALAAYLCTLGIQITSQSLNAQLKGTRTVLLFDGIDEVVKHSPWIMAAMKVLADTCPLSQVITSTRMSGRYLEAVPFLPVKLLPFTNDQLTHFVEAWFKDKPECHVRNIACHLAETPEVRELVCNPLLATVMCVLEEHSVCLPDSEYRLYQERFNLLLGHYDLHKGVSRVESQRHNLEVIGYRVGCRQCLGRYWCRLAIRKGK